jgi:hypothetical protein
MMVRVLDWTDSGVAMHGVRAPGPNQAHPSCADAETRNIVSSRMRPASNGSLHATLQKGHSRKDYWQMDVDEMHAAARSAPHPPPEPKLTPSGSPLLQRATHMSPPPHEGSAHAQQIFLSVLRDIKEKLDEFHGVPADDAAFGRRWSSCAVVHAPASLHPDDAVRLTVALHGGALFI